MRTTTGPYPWWRHDQMETFFALLSLCGGNHRSPPPPQRQVIRSFHVFFDLSPNKRLSKQSRRRWFETQSRSLWRHCTKDNILWGLTKISCWSGTLLYQPSGISLCMRPVNERRRYNVTSSFIAECIHKTIPETVGIFWVWMSSNAVHLS